MLAIIKLWGLKLLVMVLRCLNYDLSLSSELFYYPILTTDYIPHLKDKTISLRTSKVIRDILNKDEDSQRVSWKDTTLLLVYLSSRLSQIDHSEFLNDLENTEDFEDILDYLIIRIVPKEKEFKIDYRGFGCRKYLSRAATNVQEHTAKHFLEDYSDEHALSLSELDIARKLLAFRNTEKAYKGHRVLRINIDATAWNNKFRDESVYPVMHETLDKLYNTTLFGKTHKAYEKTLCYVPDEFKNYHWIGQLGGIEGQNQYTWVVVYLAMIKAALEKFEFKYHILCKGDDLRIAVLVPSTVLKNRGMEAIRLEVVTTIKNALIEMGHSIKVTESYASEYFFAFSKIASICEIELPQTYRKIQKCYGANNAFLPFLDSYIASKFSNAHSACKVTVNNLACYMTAVLWSLYYLMHSSGYQQLSNKILLD